MSENRELSNLKEAGGPSEANKEKVFVTATYKRSGPLPSPQELHDYGLIIPDGAERIMRMAENQSAHRMNRETEVIQAQIQQSARGQVFALIIGLSGMGLATYAATSGHDTFGMVIGGTTLLSLVSAFLYSKHLDKAELATKRQQMEPPPASEIPQSKKQRRK